MAGAVPWCLETSPPEIPRFSRTETQLTERLVRETTVLRCIETGDNPKGSFALQDSTLSHGSP